MNNEPRDDLDKVVFTGWRRFTGLVSSKINSLLFYHLRECYEKSKEKSNRDISFDHHVQQEMVGKKQFARLFGIKRFSCHTGAMQQRHRRL